MKLGQNVCLDEISDKFKNGSCRVKNLVTKSNLRKTLCMLERPHFQSDYHKSWSPFALMKSWTSTKMGHVSLKTRSLCQILEKPCVSFRGHIFSNIIMKLYQNVCLDEISVKFKNGSCWVKN